MPPRADPCPLVAALCVRILRPQPRGATPFPSGETPLPGGETPLPSGETPLPSGETPLPGGETPLPSGETPLPRGETPLPSGETPLPSGETPLPGGETPLPSGEPPLPRGETPLPRGETPLPRGETPLPGGETPLPSGETPLPSGETPLPSGETPLPGGETPLPGGETRLPSGETPLPGRAPVTPHRGVRRRSLRRRRVVERAAVDQTAVALVMGHADGHGAGAASARAGGGEVDVIDAAVAAAVTLGADRGVCRADACGIRGAGGRLILEDAGDRDGHRTGGRIDDASDADGDEFVIRRPEQARARRGAGAIGWRWRDHHRLAAALRADRAVAEVSAVGCHPVVGPGGAHLDVARVAHASSAHGHRGAPEGVRARSVTRAVEGKGHGARRREASREGRRVGDRAARGDRRRREGGDRRGGRGPDGHESSHRGRGVPSDRYATLRAARDVPQETRTAHVLGRAGDTSGDRNDRAEVVAGVGAHRHARGGASDGLEDAHAWHQLVRARHAIGDRHHGALEAPPLNGGADSDAVGGVGAGDGREDHVWRNELGRPRRAAGDGDDGAVERDGHARAGARAGNVDEGVRPGDDLNRTCDAIGDGHEDALVAGGRPGRETRGRAGARNARKQPDAGHGLRRTGDAAGDRYDDGGGLWESAGVVVAGRDTRR